MALKIIDMSLDAFYVVLEDNGETVVEITLGEAGVLSLEVGQPISPTKLRTFIYDASKKYKVAKGAIAWQENEG